MIISMTLLVKFYACLEKIMLITWGTKDRLMKNLKIVSICQTSKDQNSTNWLLKTSLSIRVFQNLVRVSVWF